MAAHPAVTPESAGPVPVLSSVVTIAVFDVDGVVADLRHRLHYVEGGWKNWDGFFSEVADDAPLQPGLDLVAELGEQHEIVWLTGRPSWLWRDTVDWMALHGLPHDEVHMRPGGDFRPARRFKLEVLTRLAPRDIAAFVDDDIEVIDAALAAGLPAIFADWLPRDRALRDVQDRFGRS
jgi:phosphoglycolate phosphatase-like HAD superfamily hydrolase